MTYLMGITGSVASGKSTLAARLQRFLSHRQSSLTVGVICTDGFLYPNQHLESRGLLNKKGFPESYDTEAFLRFLSEAKRGNFPLLVPSYSHLRYDILPDTQIRVDRPDLLIVEGLNVLSPSIIDFFDFSVYLHAEEHILESWYVARFLRLCEEGHGDPEAYFHRYVGWQHADLVAHAALIWREVNLQNLRQHILPNKDKASLVLNKSINHAFL